MSSEREKGRGRSNSGGKIALKETREEESVIKEKSGNMMSYRLWKTVGNAKERMRQIKDGQLFGTHRIPSRSGVLCPLPLGLGGFGDCFVQ